MKVVHVISGLGRGGAERMLVRLIEAHVGNELYRHEVISLTTLGVYGVLLEAMGVRVHALEMNRLAHVPLACLQLVRLLRTLKPDIVQTWMYHADLLGGLAARYACSAPVLWGIHSLDLKRGGNWRTRLIQRMCARMSSWLPFTILCVADASRKLHIAAGYDPSRFEVIPNGFDTSVCAIAADRVAAFKASCGIPSDALVVGCVGRFSPAKDHRNFVEACARTALEYPQTWFLMVGRGLDSFNKVLRAWLNESGVAERFVLLGERDDVPVALAAMDVFCSSSRTEAFPLVVGEAMVLARPCVVTDVGDTSVLVGDTAILVERENSQGLADGLCQVLGLSPEARVAMGLRAQERVCCEFSTEHVLRRTEEIYARALEQTGLRHRDFVEGVN